MRYALLLQLWASVVKAEVSKRPDGIHSIDKRPLTTGHSRLHPRDAGNVCGADMRLCPSSLGGNCCPKDYECASQSCYATTKGPSTCGTKVGWYGCAAVFGGGCCPDGYMCQRAANCVPPSGSPYTYGCPASQYLCPRSMNYGCCPNGMGCAVDQCYSTSRGSMETAMVVTTTDQGRVVRLTTMLTGIAPTSFPGVSPDMASEDQKVLKYYPAAIPKVLPPGGGDTAGSSGISRAQLGGIVAGCVSIAVLAFLAVFLLWRRVRGSGETPEEPHSQEPSNATETKKATDWDVDSASADGAVTTPYTGRRQRESPSVHGSTEQTPTTPVGGRSRQAGYFDHWPRRSPAAYSEHDSSPVRGGHVRAVSDFSDVSSCSPRRRGPPAELEASPGISELPSPPSSMSSAAADHWSRLDAGVLGWAARPPPPAYSQQFMKSIDGWASNVVASRLDVVDEEKRAPG